MIEVIKVLLIACFACIAVQDSRERMVYWFLYMGVAVLGGTTHMLINGIIPSLASFLLNLAFILCIILIAFLYCKLKMRQQFLNSAIGIGDILLFVGLCFSFTPVPFVVLVVFSLLFSLLLHQLIRTPRHATVPLAGYMSLFFAAVYAISFVLPDKYLYS